MVFYLVKFYKNFIRPHTLRVLGGPCGQPTARRRANIQEREQRFLNILRYTQTSCQLNVSPPPGAEGGARRTANWIHVAMRSEITNRCEQLSYLSPPEGGQS